MRKPQAPSPIKNCYTWHSSLTTPYPHLSVEGDRPQVSIVILRAAFLDRPPTSDYQMVVCCSKALQKMAFMIPTQQTHM